MVSHDLTAAACPWLSLAECVFGFTVRNFSVIARSLEVGGVTPPCLGKHDKPLVRQLTSPVVPDCCPIVLRE